MRQSTGPMPGTSRQRGFSLIELMITVFVAAILLAIAIPSFKGVISRTHLGGAHDDLLSAMRYARTEAVSRGIAVAVSASSSGAWDDGWNVKPAGTSTVLRAHAAFAPRYTVTADPATATDLSFNAQGGADKAVCFTFADSEAGSVGKKLYFKILPSGSIHSADSCS